MTAARFLLGQLIVALLLGALFLGYAALALGSAAGVPAAVLLATAALCWVWWLLQAHAYVEAVGVIRQVWLTDMAVYQLAEVTIDSDDPKLTVHTAMTVFEDNLPGPGDPVRLRIPLHRPRLATLVEDRDDPPLAGVTVLVGRRIRFGLGRWHRLAGRPAWTAMSAERLLDHASELIGETVLAVHRWLCRPSVEALRLTPEFLALDAVFDVQWPTIVRRALRDQGEIYDATEDWRVPVLPALVLPVVMLALAVVVVPDAARLLVAGFEALLTGSVEPVLDRLHWDAAVERSGLPHLDLYLVAAGVSIMAVALVGWAARTARQSRRAYRTWRWNLTEVIRQRLRAEYQRVANEQQPPVLSIRSAPGFAVLSADQVVPRSEAAQLRGLAFELGAGAVAISGSRGVGKTTLLRTLTAGENSDTLGLVVSAPVRYEPRDFLLHLYGQLCRTILDRLGEERARSRLRRAVSQVRRLLAWLLSITAYLSLLMIEFVGTREWLAEHWAFPRLTGTYVIVWGALLVLADWVRGPAPARELALAAEAAKRLRQTRFLQTVSAERTAGAGKGPMTVGLRRARQWAEQPQSLPELVDSYRSFATVVAEWWRAETNGRGKLLIAVDEADRIADPLLAEQFVNEIKGTFGVPHCVFLVSLSDEALAGFERRMVRVRTVFDSAFDHVVRLRALTLPESLDLLRHRVPGVPDVFWALCHCMAGGMPRDVLRMARTMLDEHRTSGGPTALPAMAERLVALEVQAVKHAFRHQTADDIELPGLLADAGWPGRSGEDLRRAALHQLDPESAVGAMFLYYATVLEIFAPGRVVIDETPIGEVAEVHQLIAVNPAVAVEQLRRIRQRINEAA